MMLKDLLSKWREAAANSDEFTRRLITPFANQLQPFVEREQEDMELMKRLYEAVRDSGWNPDDHTLDEARERLKEFGL